MSFLLRGNTRELRFTGEVRSLAPAPHEPITEDEVPPEDRAPSLGQPRSRRAPSVMQQPVVIRPRAVSLGGNLPRQAPVRVPGRPPPPTIDPGFLDRADDDLETMLYQRPPASHLLPSLAPENTPTPAPPPIPHFRGAPSPRPRADQLNAKTVLVSRRHPETRLPLVVWIAAALVAGALSYRFVPDLVTRVDSSTVTPLR